jgi:hypothetical protein
VTPDPHANSLELWPPAGVAAYYRAMFLNLSLLGGME